MKAVVLDLDTMKPKDLDLSRMDEFQSRYDVNWQYYNQTQPEDCLERVRDADIIFSNKVVVDEDIMSCCSNLKYIGVLATGTNNIDLVAAERHGVEVKNVAGYGTHSVVQHTVQLMLALSGSLLPTVQQVAKGDWSNSQSFCLMDQPMMSLYGKHLVILGYGALGQQMEKVALALGMKVSIASRPGEIATNRKSFDELLPDADIISLHCLLSESTNQLINKERLMAMKETAFLLNSARGGLVDENALLWALHNNIIAGAGLDVLSVEPPPASHPLIEFMKQSQMGAKLIITPHCAWATKEARQNLWNIAMDHLDDYLNANKN